MSITQDQARLVEAECLKVLTAFYRHLDAREYQAVLDLWHPQGRWVRERPLTKDEMAASMQKRSPTGVVHHIVTSALFEPQADRVAFTCYVTSLRGDTGEPAAGVIPITSLRLYLAKGELRRSGEAWLLSDYDPGGPRLELVDPTVPAVLTTLKKDQKLGS